MVWDHWADVSLRILALIAIIDSLSASFLSLLEKKFFESRTHLTHSPYAPMEKDIWIQQPQSVGSSVVALPPRPRGRRRIAAPVTVAAQSRPDPPKMSINLKSM